MVRAALSALAIVVVAAAGVALYFSVWREDTISIRVRGLEETVTQGTTLVEAAERFGLRRASGDLLDVQGGVLKRGAFPGRLLLNSRVAPTASELEEDDRLRVVDGRSRREPTMHVFVPVPGGIPANPQFTLARARRARRSRGDACRARSIPTRPTRAALGGRRRRSRSRSTTAPRPTPAASSPC